MTKRDPKDSVHEEQFNAEEKAIESTEETLIEMAASDQPAAKAGTDHEDALPEDVVKAEDIATAEESSANERAVGEAVGEDP